MANAEMFWHAEKGRDFLADVQSFCRSLDDWQIVFDLVNDTGTEVALANEGYSLTPEGAARAFTCPECRGRKFEVAQGSLDGRPMLGLLCRNCETYGVLAPLGL